MSTCDHHWRLNRTHARLANWLRPIKCAIAHGLRRLALAARPQSFPSVPSCHRSVPRSFRALRASSDSTP
eukprot:9275748-Pyramimonas_sp.AAC.1